MNQAETTARFFGRLTRASAVTYAVGVGLNGLFWTVFGLLWWFYAGGHLPPGVALFLMLPGGLLFLLLSVFIWRGARWAMIAVYLLVPLHWAIMLGPNPWLLLTHPANLRPRAFLLAPACQLVGRGQTGFGMGPAIAELSCSNGAMWLVPYQTSS